MVTFQNKDNTTEERKEFKTRQDIRMVLEKDISITPPESKPHLHPPRHWKARYFEGGSLAEALPLLEIGLMEGCTVFWNHRQYTEADIGLHKGLSDLEERMSQLKKDSLEKLSNQNRDLVGS
jgi:hypothetical protein